MKRHALVNIILYSLKQYLEYVRINFVWTHKQMIYERYNYEKDYKQNNNVCLIAAVYLC